MNLVAKEYVAAQDPDDPGVLILSEFAGAAQQLSAALIVNPNDKLEVAEAISDALCMSQRERVTRWESMIGPPSPAGCLLVDGSLPQGTRWRSQRARHLQAQLTIPFVARSGSGAAMAAEAPRPRPGLRPARTHASCGAVSIAPGRIARTAFMAFIGSVPSCTRMRAATMPARPRPPLQWTRTFDPPCKMHAMDLNSFFQVVSNRALGKDTSAIGQWCHSMCRRRTCWPMSALSRASNSCGSTRVSTAAAFHAATASRSVARSRCHEPDIAPGCFLPGAKVTPTSPSPRRPTPLRFVADGTGSFACTVSSGTSIKGSGALPCGDPADQSPLQAPRDRNAARPACAHGVLPSPFNDCMHALFATEVERNVRAPDMTVYERCPDLKGLGEGQKPGRGRELLDHLVDIVR